MNYLMSIIFSFLTVSPVNFFADINGDANEANLESYCNARFDFCVEYPKDVFTIEINPASADGIFMSTSNKEVTMAVYGEYNALGYTLEQQHEFLLKTLSETDGYIKDHLTIFSNNSFTTNIDLPLQQIEIRCQQVGNHFVTVIIRMNEKNNPKYLNLNDEIKVKIII